MEKNTILSNKEIGSIYFEDQFNKRKNLEFFGGEIEFVDLLPEKLKKEIPTLFAPGWAENPDTLKVALKELNLSGRRVLSLKHVRKGGNIEEGKTEDPIEELRKAEAILAILKTEGIKRIDAVAHSEGAINIILAASLHPELFRHIVLVSPGGLIGKHSLFKLFIRFAMENGKSLIDGQEHSVAEIPRYFFQNPKRALKEAFAISKYDIREKIKELHDKGIGVTIVNGLDDLVFPMEDMQNKSFGGGGGWFLFCCRWAL